VIAVLSAARVIAVGVLAMAGVGWDLAERRVPNVLTMSGAVLGLAWAGLTQGGSGLAWSVAGCAVGLALFLPLFLVGGLGAGDVKLLAAFGAWLGPGGVVWAALWASILGGVMALVVAAWRGYLGRALRNVGAIIGVWWTVGPGRIQGLTLDEAPGPRLAYALPIAAGALLAMWLKP